MKASAMSRKSNRGAGLFALFCLLLVGSLLALSLVVAKFADAAGAPRLMFLMVAMTGGGLILFGIAVSRHQPMPMTLRTLEYAVVSGALFALPNALAFLAVRHVGAGFISLSFAFPILLTWILAVGLGLEKLSLLRFAGVSFGLAGGVVLAIAKAGGADGAWLWAALVLAMPVVIAIANIYRTLRWPAEAGPIFLAALMLIGGAIALLPFVIMFEGADARALFLAPAALNLVLAEALVFAVLYLFYFVLQRLAGPVYLSQIGTVAALVGTLVAIFALGEGPPPNLAAAAALITLGTALFQRGAPAAISSGDKPAA